MAGGRTRVRRMIASEGQRPGRAVLAMVIVACILLVAAVVFLILHVRDQGIEQARAEAIAAAEEKVPALLTYDHRTLETDIDAKSELLTGGFSEEYTNLLRTVVLPAAQQNRLITSTQVQAAGAMSEDGVDRVTILVFVDQSTGPEGQAPTTAGSRVRVTMERPADDWLVSEITPV